MDQVPRAVTRRNSYQLTCPPIRIRPKPALARAEHIPSVGMVRNVTARIRFLRHTDVMSTKKESATSSRPQSGDVLVSRSPAVREHDISIVPNAPHARCATHAVAVSDGRAEAQATGVDAWLTQDQTHAVKIASHRTPSTPSPGVFPEARTP
jgi:hypothetical protein